MTNSVIKSMKNSQKNYFTGLLSVKMIHFYLQHEFYTVVIIFYMSNIKYNGDRLHNEADFGQKNALFEAVARKNARHHIFVCLFFSKTYLSSITYMNFQKTEI